MGRFRDPSLAAGAAAAAAAAAAAQQPSLRSSPQQQQQQQQQPVPAAKDKTYTYALIGTLSGMVAGWVAQYID